MAFEMTVTAVVKDETGTMCTQTTHWERMDQGEMLTLEGSYLAWLASLPKSIGGATDVKHT